MKCPSITGEFSVTTLPECLIKVPLAAALVLMRGVAARVLSVATLLTQFAVSGFTLPFDLLSASSITGLKVVTDSESAHTECLPMMEILLDTDHFELLEDIAESGDPSLVGEGVLLTPFT